MDTCTYRHTWKRSGRSAVSRGKQEAATKIQTKLPRSKTLIRNKRLADFKHKNGGYTTRHPSLNIAPRTDHDIPATADCVATWKTMALKSQPFAPADWKHKPQPMSCSQPHHKRERESTWPTETPWNSPRPTLKKKNRNGSCCGLG